jgi:exopolysaccharide production protein ExoQ
MSPLLATLVYAVGIGVIFYFDRDERDRTSGSLWVPVAWLLINGSRPVSAWFQTGTPAGEVSADGSPLDAAVYGAIIAAGVVVLCTRGRRVLDFVKSNPVILLFVAYCLISTMWADDGFVAFKRWIKSAGDVIMIVIVLTDPNPLAAIKRFLCRAGYVLIPASILCIKYYPQWGRAYNPWTWEPMYTGVTTFKNLLGMTVLVGALATLWCAIRSWYELQGMRRWQHLGAEAVILAMSVYLLLTADSMTSFSCLMLAGTVMIVASRSFVMNRPWILHLTVAAAISIAVVALFFDNSGGMVKELGRNSSLTGRTAIWSEVIVLSRQFPWFGAGFESFWMGDRLLIMWRVVKGIQEAHDGYLEVYANLGWVGIALLGTLIVVGYRNVMDAWRRNVTIGTVKMGFFVTALIYSLTEAGFRMMSPVWLGFLLATITIPPRRLKRKTASVPSKVASLEPEPYPSLAATYKAGF